MKFEHFCLVLVEKVIYQYTKLIIDTEDNVATLLLLGICLTDTSFFSSKYFFKQVCDRFLSLSTVEIFPQFLCNQYLAHLIYVPSIGRY